MKTDLFTLFSTGLSLYLFTMKSSIYFSYNSLQATGVRGYLKNVFTTYILVYYHTSCKSNERDNKIKNCME